MMTSTLYESIQTAANLQQKQLCILIDPEKFSVEQTAVFLRSLPADTTHLLVGGSTVARGMTETVVKELKRYTAKPIILFPGDHTQITDAADGLLFLSLLSGRNPEYLIGEQTKAVSILRNSPLEVIPTGYILIEGGNQSAVARVTQTRPMSQENISAIVDTAKAGEFMGAKLIYLEAGSGAMIPVSAAIIKAVKKVLRIPLIVGGGIRNSEQLQAAYNAGADMVVMGNVFEKQ
jgi:phosphoglycerol geranylgeranyltransferase